MLKHYVDNGLFLKGSVTENGKANRDLAYDIRKICRKEFDGTIKHCSVYKIEETLWKKERHHSRRVRFSVEDESPLHSAIREVALQDVNNPGTTADEKYRIRSHLKYIGGGPNLGHFSCNRDEKILWSVYMAPTGYSNKAENRIARTFFDVISLVILDRELSPVLDRTISEHEKREPLLIEERKKESQKRSDAYNKQRQEQAAKEEIEKKKRELFLSTLQPGTNTNCGLVVEVKGPIVLIQPDGINTTAKWISRNRLNTANKYCSAISPRY